MTFTHLAFLYTEQSSFERGFNFIIFPVPDFHGYCRGGSGGK